MYATLKLVHIACAALTLAGFVLRGYWMMVESDLLAARPTRVLPHVVDTAFLLSGIGLLVVMSMNPLMQPWLLAKFAGLAAYIVLGTIALRRGRTRSQRVLAFVASIAVFVAIVGVATTRSVAGWLAI